MSVFVLRHPAEKEPKGSRKGVESKPKWSQTRVLRPSRVRMAASCRPRHRQSKHTSVPWLPTSSSYLSPFFLSWFVYNFAMFVFLKLQPLERPFYFEDVLSVRAGKGLVWRGLRNEKNHFSLRVFFWHERKVSLFQRTSQKRTFLLF